MQKTLTVVLIVNIILLLIAVDTLGLAKALCDSPKFYANAEDAECIAKTRITLYVGLSIALVILVPLQIIITMLFQSLIIDEERPALSNKKHGLESDEEARLLSIHT